MLLELALAVSLLLGGGTAAQSSSAPPPSDTTSTSEGQEVDPGGETDARAYIIDLG